MQFNKIKIERYSPTEKQTHKVRERIEVHVPLIRIQE